MCLYQRASQENLNKWCKAIFVIYCRGTPCVCIYLQPLVLSWAQFLTLAHASQTIWCFHTSLPHGQKKKLDQRSQHKADAHTHARLKHKRQLVLKMKTALHSSVVHSDKHPRRWLEIQNIWVTLGFHALDWHLLVSVFSLYMKNWTSADITSVSSDSAGMQYSDCHTVLWGHKKYNSNPNSVLIYLNLCLFFMLCYICCDGLLGNKTPQQFSQITVSSVIIFKVRFGFYWPVLRYWSVRAEVVF